MKQPTRRLPTPKENIMASTHTPISVPTRRTGMRRFTQAALVAAAFAIAASGFGHTALASAEPPWDIEAYDNCMQRPDADEGTCCVLSNGVWGANGHCQAPPGRILQPTILQHIPLGPNLGSARPPTTTLGSPVS
jgi:hypothetical protein